MKKRVFLVIAVLMTFAISGIVQAYAAYTPSVEKLIADEINEAKMVEYVVDLCTGTMGPVGHRVWSSRTQGTPYGDASNLYVKNKFISWGLDKVEIFNNPTPRNFYYLETWELTSPDYDFLPDGNWPCTFSADATADGELIFVGAGTAATDYPAGVAGKIVLCYGSPRRAYPLAQAAGAIGLLSYSPNSPGDYPPASSEVARCSSITYSATNSIPAFTLSYTDGTNLKTLLETPTTVNVHMDVVAEIRLNQISKSVIATINGRSTSGRYMMIYAHANADAGNMGADDNASGVAVLMELARVIQKLINDGTIPRPNFSIKFMVIGTELFDTPAYLDVNKAKLSKIIGGINFDQAGLGIEHDMVNLEGSDLPIAQPLLNTLRDIGKDYTGTYWESDNYHFIPFLGGSDHEAFIDAGVSTTYIWTDWAPQWATNPPKWKDDEVFIDGIPYYHSSGDTPENTVMVEPQNMVYVARFAGLLTTRVCDFTSMGT